MSLVSELRRRNVLRMAVLYVVAAWLIMQVADAVIGLANLPDWIGLTILILLAIGFPIALIVSWFYEVTPEGIALEKDVAPGESITHVTGLLSSFCTSKSRPTRNLHCSRMLRHVSRNSTQKQRRLVRTSGRTSSSINCSCRRDSFQFVAYNKRLLPEQVS